MKMLSTLSLLLALHSSWSFAEAAIRPGQRFEAQGVKREMYISEGYFTGGHASVTSVKLKDIRRAKSGSGTKTYERVVFDLAANSATEKSEVPYFQIQSAPKEGRLILSIWSDVMYDFDIAKVRKAFSKSPNIKKLNVLPRVEDGLAVMEFSLQPSKEGKDLKFEVFHLSNPPRIIVDLR